MVLTSACTRRHSSTIPWSPERKTSGTSQPRKVAGRVYCGYSSRPVVKLSSSADRSLPEHTREQPDHRLHDHQCGQLATCEYEVADREFVVGQVVGDPLVDAFVTAAQKGKTLVAAGQLSGDRLVESPSGRREQHERPRQAFR